MNNLKKIMFLLAISSVSLSMTTEHNVITSNEIDWGLLNPARGDASPKAANLWGDRTKEGATGMLVKFEKGFSSPPHIHNISYRGVVIKGLMHNDDPNAAMMWLPPGSFWTQPAGEDHITAANGEENLIYLEIDSGPYLVLGSEEAFDNGERPINLDETNLVWVTADDADWIASGTGEIAFLWGNLSGDNGTFLKLPANFNGYIEDDSMLKAVVIEGNFEYKWGEDGEIQELTPSAFFSSEGDAKHYIMTGNNEVLLYMRNLGSYSVEE